MFIFDNLKSKDSSECKVTMTIYVEQDAINMRLESLLQMFIEEMTTIRQFSTETVKAYKHDIEMLLKFMKSQSIQNLSKLTYDDFVNLLKHLRERLQASSIRRAVFAWKSFFKFLHREKKITHKAWRVIGLLEPPKAWDKVPEILSQKEMCELLDSLEEGTQFEQMTKVILEMLYATGVRVSELCNLIIKDINLKAKTILIKNGKGCKDRIVIVGALQVKMMKNYWERFRKAITNEDYAIVNTRGNKLDRINVFKLFKKVIKSHGITKHISPVTFRHCYATHMLENGADIRIVQELLGHENIGNTERYLNLSMEIIKRNFYKYSN